MNDNVANRPEGEANAAHASTNDLASIASNGLGVLRAIMAISDDCIKVLDLSGRVLFLNDGGVRALGRKPINGRQGFPSTSRHDSSSRTGAVPWADTT